MNCPQCGRPVGKRGHTFQGVRYHPYCWQVAKNDDPRVEIALLRERREHRQAVRGAIRRGERLA